MNHSTFQSPVNITLCFGKNLKKCFFSKLHNPNLNLKVLYKKTDIANNFSLDNIFVIEIDKDIENAKTEHNLLDS